MKKVLITGGTGLIGSALCETLIAKGYQVSILSRNKKKIENIKTYHWDINAKKIDVEAIQQADYIVHLAGKNIGDQKWTSNVKKEIILSRINSTALLYNYIKQYNTKLKAFISSSAVGYYGLKYSDHAFTENDKPGKDFLAGVCVKWEEYVPKIAQLGIRTAIIRTGVVLSKKGGALEQMILPVKLGLVAALGSGKQYIPWIHLQDICSLYLKAIEDKNFDGVFNGVGMEHVQNKDFTKALAKQLNRPFILPSIPAFIIRLAIGERSVIALKGNKISAKKLIQHGFKFKYSKLEDALKHLLQQKL